MAHIHKVEHNIQSRNWFPHKPDTEGIEEIVEAERKETVDTEEMEEMEEAVDTEERPELKESYCQQTNCYSHYLFWFFGSM
mmetsp:Transcript_13337/g.20582  ORF Transcript_13337/g.20582 Transcript_13337/m.20582 type:complete len:81 (+) Transcript_13337:387-629(+)